MFSATGMFVSIGGPCTTTISTLAEPAATEHDYYDFISFLAVAQACDLNFLPMTWQPALEALGAGGTAQINQSLVNLRTSYAFKRTTLWNDPRNLYGSAKSREIFRALVSEISALSHPALRTHPNIVDLEGICWDPTMGASEIWPVLVTEKSPWGDIQHFAHSINGATTTVLERTSLCADVGAGILSMHASGSDTSLVVNSLELML